MTNTKVKELYGNDTPTLENYLSLNGVKDIEEYLNPSGKYIESFELYSDIMQGAEEIKYWSTIEDSTIYIVQDGDFDGIASTFILYNYLENITQDWNLRILIHTSKQRGLDDEDIMNEIRNNKPNLVIVPDAGTNNKAQAEELCELGIGLIVIDHHEYSTPIEKGLLINNQNSLYNVQRNGSGALVTHKFLYGLDKVFNKQWASWFIDIVALSLISDSMNMSEMENREYYHFGLETRDCVNNLFLGALIDKFIGDKPYTQRDISFKIIPKMNSICRCKDQGLKQKLLLAFLGFDIDEMLELCEKAHKEQIDTIANIMEENKDSIKSLSNNNIIFFASDDIPRSYSGLVCGKVMNLCDNKPSIVGSIKDGYFIGSLRSPIPLRTELDNNELVDFCQGHEESAGFGIKEENIQPFINYYNSLEMNYEPCRSVLKSYSIKSIPKSLFGLYDDYSALWGKGINKPLFHITNIKFKPNDIQIIGDNKRTLKIKTNECDILIFSCLKEDKEKLKLGYYNNDEFVEKRGYDTMCMECIGYLGLNIYTSKKTHKTYITPQIIIEEYELSKPIRDISKVF